MGVTTDADKKIRESKEKIDKAIELLLEASHKDIWGFEEYSDEYMNDVLKCVIELRIIKGKL